MPSQILETFGGIGFIFAWGSLTIFASDLYSNYKMKKQKIARKKAQLLLYDFADIIIGCQNEINSRSSKFDI